MHIQGGKTRDLYVELERIQYTMIKTETGFTNDVS